MNIEYLHVIDYVYNNGIICSPRKIKIKEVLNYTFILKNPKERISTLKPFDLKLKYASAELDWYLSGTNRIDMLPPRYAKIWEQWSDDNIHVNSAYGYYIFGKHPNIINQWKWVLNLLRIDPDSRQAIININHPIHKEKPTKDFPCCVTMQFFIRNNKLHLTVYFRSNDLAIGFKNDVFTMTALQEIMANQLNIPLGIYTHFIGSLHLYEKHWKNAQNLLNLYQNSNIINIEHKL